MPFLIKLDNIMATETFPLVLKWVKMVTPNVRHLAFATSDGRPFVFIPGQFISIHFTSGEALYRRSYSIASIPTASEDIEIALSYFKGGVASEYLFNLQPGDTVQASGPYGRLVLRDEQPRRYILVATGTGVTPYRAMLPSLAERMIASPELKVTVLLGVQSRSDLLYADDFRLFAGQHPNFDFYVCYSRETSPDLALDERFGYVQNMFPALGLNPEHDILYLCGNPQMIDDAVTQLKEAGFTIQQVRREKYVS
jgi:ferredoxin-NADP reductase